MSEKTLVVRAPAKINLSLRILGKREDGYHELETVMTRVPDLCDVLTFREAEAFTFDCRAFGVPKDEKNLVVQATLLFAEKSGKACDAAITLDKHIPQGAGMGGGSSDAAATLLAWNQWYDHPLSHDELVEIASKIGSDVPFFLGTETMLCRGRGELLSPMPELAGMSVVIFKPHFAVATADAYRRWADATELPGVSYAAQQAGNVEFYNDLEKPVFRKFCFLAELKSWLVARPEVQVAMMTGSGSAVFAILEPNRSAQDLIALCRERLDPTMWAWHGTIGGHS